jgi:hypothetical protein
MTSSSTTPTSLFSWLMPLLVALLCWLLWWGELTYWVPQQPYAWTQHHWYSVYPIIVLIIGVFLWPLQRAFDMPWRWLLFYGLLLALVSGSAYWVIHSIFQNLYLDFFLGDPATNLMAWSIWKLLALALVVALFYFLPLWHFHTTTDGMHILTLLEVFILVVPCSLISLECFPMGSTSISFINAVKLGYPVFWLPIGLGYLSRAVAWEWL